MNTHRIQETADQISDIQVRSVNIYIVAKTFGSMLFFAVIGLALAMQAYNPNPDPAVITGFVLVLIMVLLTLIATMTYGPLAAVMVELFPTRIRYTSMSLPYHIGNAKDNPLTVTSTEPSAWGTGL